MLSHLYLYSPSSPHPFLSLSYSPVPPETLALLLTQTTYVTSTSTHIYCRIDQLACIAPITTPPQLLIALTNHIATVILNATNNDTINALLIDNAIVNGVPQITEKHILDEIVQREQEKINSWTELGKSTGMYISQQWSGKAETVETKHTHISISEKIGRFGIIGKLTTNSRKRIKIRLKQREWDHYTLAQNTTLQDDLLLTADLEPYTYRLNQYEFPIRMKNEAVKDGYTITFSPSRPISNFRVKIGTYSHVVAQGPGVTSDPQGVYISLKEITVPVQVHLECTRTKSIHVSFSVRDTVLEVQSAEFLECDSFRKRTVSQSVAVWGLGGDDDSDEADVGKVFVEHLMVGEWMFGGIGL